MGATSAFLVKVTAIAGGHKQSEINEMPPWNSAKSV